MKFLFVTYRWGRDIVGGAEIHHQRLVDDLVKLGHEVEIWTTTGKDIGAVAHWGVDWNAGYEAGDSTENGIAVRRFPLDPCFRSAIGIGCKMLQRKIDSIPSGKGEQNLRKKVFESANDHFLSLWNGWYHPEGSGDSILRWCHTDAGLLLKTLRPGNVVIRGMSPEQKVIQVFSNDIEIHSQSVEGDFEIRLPLSQTGSDLFLKLKTSSATRPLKDHRSLGFLCSSITFEYNDQELPCVKADFFEDMRAHGRRHLDEWWQVLEERQPYLSPTICKLFDWLRGPRSRKLSAALSNIPDNVDLVIACNFPWSTVPVVAKYCKTPWVAMALWHLEDEYYYWPHYLEALKKSRFVLANTPWSANGFFKQKGITAEFVGPGIVADIQDSTPVKEDNKFRVLTVSRKSPEKRYDMIVEAVELLKKDYQVDAELIFIGPDADQRPLPDWVDYRGRVSDEELNAAYHECDVFVLMSESESFGMVLAEAWLRKKPVITNSVCGPASSLIDDGQDGRIVDSVPSLAKALKYYAENPEMARRHGIAGEEKTRKDFLQRAATERFLDAVKKHS